MLTIMLCSGSWSRTGSALGILRCLYITRDNDHHDKDEFDDDFDMWHDQTLSLQGLNPLGTMGSIDPELMSSPTQVWIRDSLKTMAHKFCGFWITYSLEDSSVPHLLNIAINMTLKIQTEDSWNVLATFKGSSTCHPSIQSFWLNPVLLLY